MPRMPENGHDTTSPCTRRLGAARDGRRSVQVERRNKIISFRGSKPKFLWVYIGYLIFAGILANFVINPIMEYVNSFAGWSFRHFLYFLCLTINLVAGFFVFRFIVGELGSYLDKRQIHFDSDGIN